MKAGGRPKLLPLFVMAFVVMTFVHCSERVPGDYRSMLAQMPALRTSDHSCLPLLTASSYTTCGTIAALRTAFPGETP
jgi:hypothetical protein